LIQVNDPRGQAVCDCCSILERGYPRGIDRRRYISNNTLDVVMKLQIDDAFIGKWHPKYHETETDEPEYQRLVAEVTGEMHRDGTISEETFLRIWKWKKAARRIDLVRMDQYNDRYGKAIRQAASAPPAQKLAALLAPDVKLPGVGAPTGSTIIHFIHPDGMPIMDVRTVEVLFKAGLISIIYRDLDHYEPFRKAVDGIRHRCPSRSLREIDRALFAYHKQVLSNRPRSKSPAAASPGDVTDRTTDNSVRASASRPRRQHHMSELPAEGGNSVQGIVRNVNKYADGTPLLEIWINKDHARAHLPIVEHGAVAVEIEINGERYIAKLRNTLKNRYVWISADLRDQAGKKCRLADALWDSRQNDRVLLTQAGNKTRFYVNKIHQ
jgi:hypothetical protein